ncbi:MAG: flagellar motor switch protein FliN [Bryobacterales bacterium]|nr:flagellar motor switch protein FliN [Bryobacterales bacterium]
MAEMDLKAIGEGGRFIAEAFASAFGQSIEAMTSERPEIDWSVLPAGTNLTAETDGWLWWEQPLTAAPGSACWLGAAESTWSETGRLALAAAGLDDITAEDCRGTWMEIQGQALSSTGQALTRRIRKEVNCEKGREIDPPPSPNWSIEIRVKLGGASLKVVFGWNEALHLSAEPASEPAKPQPGSAPEGKATAAAPGRTLSPAVENSRTLELLLEVELPVSISFGRTQLPLRDVLKLNSGSIVELNRAISEPVDLIVNNCVIARGEVVVVEGNYGVRIKQIISKEERLRTLY